ncbi:MAG TPA: type II secretion system protein GspN [Polyangia bacterium]|jgi:type II secretion system protein N|nr:type II secretion system protein GspN [Polyangia bacterium]
MTELQVPEGLRRAAKWVGYPAFVLAVMIASFYLALPRDRIKERLETTASGALNADVSIETLGLTFFTGPGLDAEGIVVRTRPTGFPPGGAAGANDKPQRYVVDEVVVHPNLLDLIRKRIGGRLTAQLAGGTVRLRGSMDADETEASLEAHGLGLGQVPGVARAIGLPVEGMLDATGEVKLPKGLAAQAAGQLDILCEGCVVGDGKAKLVVPGDPLLSQGLTFPRLKLGRVQGSIVIEKGRATVKDLHARSSDVELALEGYIELRDPLPFSVLHLYLRFKPSQALVQREPTMELMSNVLGSRARRPDGFLGLSITGTFQTPLALPSTEAPSGVNVGKFPSGPPPPTTQSSSAAAPPLPPHWGEPFRPGKPGSTALPPPGGGEEQRPQPEQPQAVEQPYAAPPPAGDNPIPVQVRPANAVPPPAGGYAGGGEGTPAPPPPPGGEEGRPQPENPVPDNPSRE